MNRTLWGALLMTLMSSIAYGSVCYLERFSYDSKRGINV